MSHTLPALFIGHGTPMNALEDNRFSRDWRALAAPVGRPDAIAVISAHWVTDGLRVAATPTPRTLHDFSGFPPALFRARYPCPGAPALAEEIAAHTGAVLDHDWGLDHGSWVPLLHLFPEADIPVLQISLDARRNLQQHVELARQLQWLRERSVLVMGSGNIVHNIAKWFSNPHPADWAIEFNRDALAALRAGDLERLASLPGEHRFGRDAVPTLEHYLPFLYIAALRREGEALHTSPFGGDDLETASMQSLRVGD